MTIRGKIVAYLGKREADYRIIYVILSRVQKFSDISIKDMISKSRLCKAIRKQGKIKRQLNKEKQLKRLADITSKKYFH